jgi:hypothetical protein
MAGMPESLDYIPFPPEDVVLAELQKPTIP